MRGNNLLKMRIEGEWTADDFQSLYRAVDTLFLLQTSRPGDGVFGSKNRSSAWIRQQGRQGSDKLRVKHVEYSSPGDIAFLADATALVGLLTMILVAVDRGAAAWKKIAEAQLKEAEAQKTHRESEAIAPELSKASQLAQIRKTRAEAELIEAQVQAVRVSSGSDWPAMHSDAIRPADFIQSEAEPVMFELLGEQGFDSDEAAAIVSRLGRPALRDIALLASEGKVVGATVTRIQDGAGQTE